MQREKKDNGEHREFVMKEERKEEHRVEGKNEETQECRR